MYDVIYEIGRICLLVELAEYLDLRFYSQDFQERFAASGHKARFLSIYGASLAETIANHIFGVGKKCFAQEIKDYNQTLPEDKPTLSADEWITLLDSEIY